MNFSAVRPAFRETSVDRIDSHHSDGMLSRCDHLEVCDGLDPMSRAIASFDDQSSMTSRKDLSSSISLHLRHFVLDDKGILCGDHSQPFRQSLAMVEKRDARSKFLADFLGRTVAARKQKFASTAEMAIALGWGADAQATYSKYETRTPLPTYLIEQFCKICGVRVEWLITGRGAGPAWQPILLIRPRRQKAKKARPAA